MTRISMIVSALCEAALINGTIGAIFGLKGGEIAEIIVVDGRAGGSSYRIRKAPSP
jgi:hypothetical protein